MHRTPSFPRQSRWRHANPVFALGLALAAVSPALSQSDNPPGPAAPSAPPGMAYQHPHRQPTEAELRASGAKPPPSASRKQVEEEVKQLLQQTDRLDKHSEQQGGATHAGSSSPR